MAFEIRGKVKGDKEVVRALNRAPEIYFGVLRDWLKNERANFLGGKDAKGKKRRGYRDILASKSLRKRSGSWSRRVTGLFKGYMPFVKKINDLKLTMGVLGKSKHQLQRALELLQTGGTVTSHRVMPIPIYKNLERIGYTGAMSMGSVKTGMKSKALRNLMITRGITTIKKDGRMYFFDRRGIRSHGKAKGRGYQGAGFRKEDLLFIGVRSIRVKKQLSGRYDFYGRFNRMNPAMINRGQVAVDRATKKVERKYA